jgi:flavin reductase (DIM6/NTAB) family NADH-FMN oxidoreductase RutF
MSPVLGFSTATALAAATKSLVSVCTRPTRASTLEIPQLVRSELRCTLHASDDDYVVVAPPTDAATLTPAPWQLAPAVCYAIATFSNELGRGNFNIATYVTPCGLGLLPRFAVALYVGTLSWTTVRQTGLARLVLLTEKHAELVPLFGKRCGREVDKVAEALALGFEVSETDDGVPFLPDSLGFIDVKVDQWVDCGDHELAICSTIKHASLDHEDSAVLTTTYLREHGYVGE